jgi:hypothetical protein
MIPAHSVEFIICGIFVGIVQRGDRDYRIYQRDNTSKRHKSICVVDVTPHGLFNFQKPVHIERGRVTGFSTIRVSNLVVLSTYSALTQHLHVQHVEGDAEKNS